MVRFRLKTSFITNSRDLIRGGVIYKPSWWDAVRRVPPLGLLPRVKKKSIPKLKFLEDRLIREFEEKNPMVAQHDRFLLLGDEVQNSVAAEFAEKQIESMEEDVPEEEAYGAAEDWALDHGQELLGRMRINDTIKAGLSRDPVMELPPRERDEELFHRQWSTVKDGLRQALDANPPEPAPYAGIRPHRSFLAAEEIDALEQRRLGLERRPETLSYTDDEADATA